MIATVCVLQVPARCSVAGPTFSTNTLAAGSAHEKVGATPVAVIVPQCTVGNGESAKSLACVIVRRPSPVRETGPV